MRVWLKSFALDINKLYWDLGTKSSYVGCRNAHCLGTHCFHRGQGFSSQHLHRGTHKFLTSVPGDLRASFDCLTYLHTCYTHTDKHTHMYTYTHTDVHTHTLMYTCTHTHTCPCVCTYIDIQIQTNKVFKLHPLHFRFLRTYSCSLIPHSDAS